MQRLALHQSRIRCGSHLKRFIMCNEDLQMHQFKKVDTSGRSVKSKPVRGLKKYMGSSKKISKELAKNMTFEVLKWKKTHVTDINVVIKIKLNLSCICMLKYAFPIIV